MMMEFLANAIVGISAAFSGMWVLFQILERRSHFLWRLLGVLGIAIVQGALGLLQIPILNMTSTVLMIVGSTLLCYQCKKLYFLVYDILIVFADLSQMFFLSCCFLLIIIVVFPLHYKKTIF